mgnify:CR=1 FL=1
MEQAEAAARCPALTPVFPRLRVCLYGDIFRTFAVVAESGSGRSPSVHNESGEQVSNQSLVGSNRQLVTINNEVGLLSTGSTATSLPSGTYTYSGAVSVVENVSDIGDGTFTLTANFNTNKADITASTLASESTNNTAYFFSGSGMQIDQSEGSFSTSTGLIGVTGGASESASVKGYFAGTAAKGVHGLAYTNDTATPDLVGAFYGSR